MATTSTATTLLSSMQVLVLGGTGNVGQLVIAQLLDRGARVKALVRSPERLPAVAKGHERVAVVEGSILELSDAEVTELVQGCDAVVSCLGHVMSLQGMCGDPHRLCRDAVRRVCQAAEGLEPSPPLKVVLLNSSGVGKPDGTERVHNTWGEWILQLLLRSLIPPHADNVDAAAYLFHDIAVSRFIEWVAVRPDGFVDGPISEYTAHESLQNGILNSGQTTKANIAHFMCELLDNRAMWTKWRGKLPHLLDAKGGATTAKDL